MRFTGNIDAKVDDKGRVFVPSAFRKILQREDAGGLVLRRDVFQRCLVLYPAQVWNRQVDALVARTSMFDRQGRSALRRFVAGAEDVSLDGNGRLLIPRRYLDEAGIRSDVRFIGVDDTMEIWDREAADALSAEPDDLADSLVRLMASQDVPDVRRVQGDMTE